MFQHVYTDGISVNINHACIILNLVFTTFVRFITYLYHLYFQLLREGLEDFQCLLKRKIFICLLNVQNNHLWIDVKFLCWLICTFVITIIWTFTFIWNEKHDICVIISAFLNTFNHELKRAIVYVWIPMRWTNYMPCTQESYMMYIVSITNVK
jgi:hypothetical protein